MWNWIDSYLRRFCFRTALLLELAFLKKIDGKWQAKGVYIQGDPYDTGQTSELEFTKDGIQFIH
jgi:hypothetical protein